MKRCIFHYLHPIEDKPGIGSALRPNQMLQAFRDIGYEVDTITGYSNQRKKKIQEIRQKIKNGIHYDFVYSESVNDPTLLSDADHIPRNPFQDFGFLKFCRKQGIPVGLFYRDMHWQFPVYRNQVSRWKQMIALPLFQWDLYMYRRCVDILYVPSDALGAFVPHKNTVPLPPGGIYRPAQTRETDEIGILRIFYVGNVLGVYDITEFCAAVSKIDGVELTICTPKQSWETAKYRYEPHLCDRIHVVHKSGHQLQSHYRAADIFCCCLEVNEYTRLAMPIKVFESMGYGVPLVITEGIAAAELIAKSDCGWVIKNSTDAFESLLRRLKNNPQEIQEKTQKVRDVAPYHTWKKRAQKVAEDLTRRKEKESL